MKTPYRTLHSMIMRETAACGRMKPKPFGLKALSIKQPWAWLIVNGWKDVENRSWNTHYRGRVLIHAGKTMDNLGLETIAQIEKSLGLDIPIPALQDLPRGGIVGVS